jgi:hypothetical protein
MVIDIYIYLQLMPQQQFIAIAARRQTIIKCCGRSSCINVPKKLSHSNKTKNVGLFNVIFIMKLLMTRNFADGHRRGQKQLFLIYE